MSEYENKQPTRPRYKSNNLIQQIRGFCNTVIFGGVEKASREMHLTQPAVTSQIKALEGNLGFKLIQKTSRNIELTESGKKFYEFVIPLLRQVESIYDDFLYIHEAEQTKMLKIVSTINVIDVWLPKRIGRIFSHFPDMVVHIENLDNANNGIQMLRQNLADIAVYPLDDIPSDIKLAYTIHHKPMISVNIKNELLSQKGQISIEDLRKQNIIIVRSNSMLPIYIDLFKKYRLRSAPLKLSNVSSWNTARLYVKQNIGITFSTYQNHEDNAKDGIVDIDVSHIFPAIDYRVLYIDNKRIADMLEIMRHD